MLQHADLFIIILLLNFVFASPAYAYLDPNAGGIFLQVIVPIVFGAAAAITVFWRRMIGRIKKILNLLRGHSNSSQDE